MSEDIKFKFTGEKVSSDDFWYDLTDGGYITPSELLVDKEQIEKIEDAIDLLINFKLQLEENDLIGEN